MPISEQQAATITQAFPTLPVERQAEARRFLENYRTQQQAANQPLFPSEVKREIEAKTRMRQMFADPAQVDTLVPGFRDMAQFSSNVDTLRKRAANKQYLERISGRPVGLDYERARAAYSAKEFGQPLDDVQFFAKVGERVRKEEADEEKRKVSYSAGAEAALKAGNPYVRALAEHRAAGEDADTEGFGRGYYEIAQRLAPYRRLVDEVAKDGKAMLTSPDGYDWTALAKRMLEVPAKDRGLVLQALVQSMAAQEGGEDVSPAIRLAMAFDRGLERYIDNATTGGVSMMANRAIGALESLPTPPGMEPADVGGMKERRGEMAEFLNLRDDLRDVINGNVNPIEDVRLLGANLSGVAENLPMTLSAFVPWAGPAAMVASFQRSTYNELRRENPGMSEDAMQGIATVSAPFQALTEVVSDRLLFGRLPNLKRAFTSPALSASSIAKQLAARVGVGTATEYTEEFVQGVTPRAIQSLVSALNKDVPDVDWSGFFKRFGAESGELLAVIVPMALLGAGVGQVSDYSGTLQLAQSPELLRLSGFDNADAIAEAAKAGDTKLTEKLMRENWSAAAPAGQSPAEVAGGAAQKAEAKFQEEIVKPALEEVRRRMADEEAQLALQQQAERLGLIPRIRRDSQGWLVEDRETGAFTRVKNREEAMQHFSVAMSDMERQSSEAMAQVADEFMQMGGERQTEEVDIQRSEQTLTQEVEAGRVTEDEARKAVLLYARMNGLTEDQALGEVNQVLGNNVEETREGVRKYVSRINGGANLLTVIHEGVHGRWNAGLKSEHYTHAMGLQWVRMAEQASGATFLPEGVQDGDVTAQMLDEAIVEVVQADAVGRRKDGGHFSPGLISHGLASFALGQRAQAKETGRFRAFLAAWKGFWGQVLKRAKQMQKARKEGKLGGDFDAIMDDLLGGEPQLTHEAGVIQEAEGMGSSNVPFSLGRMVAPADAPRFEASNATVVGPALFSITAYHGTPHKVDDFKLDKIGTGEGAQSYGWGLYFAEEEGVAKTYQRDLAQRVEGNLYTVELNVEEDELLDWDKPLSEQGEKIQSVLNELELFPLESWDGQRIYQALVYEAGGDWNAAGFRLGSQLLASHGIKGIRYLDGQSRNGGSGTSNYVVFDDSLITIKEENGKPIEMAAAFSLQRNALGTRLSDLLPEKPSGESLDLVSAYGQASQGSGSAFVSVDDVWKVAKEQNPKANLADFQTQMRAMVDRGEAFMEPSEGPRDTAEAGVPLSSGMTGVRVAMIGEVRYSLGMASDPGAAQNAEPSPGGLSEAIGRQFDDYIAALRHTPVEQVKTAKLEAVVDEEGEVTDEDDDGNPTFIEHAITYPGVDLGAKFPTKILNYRDVPPGAAPKVSFYWQLEDRSGDGEEFGSLEEMTRELERQINSHSIEAAEENARFRLQRDFERFLRDEGIVFPDGETHYAERQRFDEMGEPDFAPLILASTGSLYLNLPDGDKISLRDHGVSQMREMQFGENNEVIQVSFYDPASLADGLERLAAVLQKKASSAISGQSSVGNQEGTGNLGAASPASRVSRNTEEARNHGPSPQNVNPNSTRAGDGASFSLAPRSLASYSDTVLAAKMSKPEFKEAFYRVARERLAGLMSSQGWRGGAESQADKNRTLASLNRERQFRLRSRQRELIEQIPEKVGDAAMLAYEAGAPELQSHPFLVAMFGNHGKLMSWSAAQREGRADVFAGEWDDAPMLPPSFYAKSGGTMPDVMAQSLYDDGLLNAPDVSALWSELESILNSHKSAKGEFSEARKQIKALEREARETAKKEADEWFANAKAAIPTPKERQLMALRTLDAILSAFPAEVRGKVGGFVKLAELSTDKAREKEIVRRLEMLERTVERFARDHYRDAIHKLFKRAEPEMKAGKKAKGKLGPEGHRLMSKAKAAMALTADQVEADVVGIEKTLSKGELSEEEALLLEMERELIQLFGDFKNRNSAELEAAHRVLNGLFTRSYMDWMIRELAKRERRKAQRTALKAAVGRSGKRKERVDYEEGAKGLLGIGQRIMYDVSSFAEVLWSLFGKTQVALDLEQAEREAAYQYEDALQATAEEVQDFFTELAGGKVLKGEQLRFDLSQRTFDTAAAGKMSEMEAIQALLMWQQEDGRRHMMGPLDENGMPAEDGGWHYNQAFIDEIEGKLSTNGRAVLAFLREKYAAEYQFLNPLYRARHGVDLPKNDLYAPITVKPVQDAGPDVVDPTTGVTMTSGGILSPGSLRTRSRTAVAEPDFRNALSVYLAHTKQLQYWAAYYDFATEVKALLGHRTIQNAAKAAGGDQSARALSKWIDTFAQGGQRDAAAGMAVNEMARRMTGRAATVGLLGRVSTLLVQSTQLGAASVKMPVGSYLKRFSGLMTGRMQWGDAIRSDFIQRRIKQAPPIVRQAMEGLGEAKRPNQISRAVRHLGALLSGADGLFTAGTYAILLDWHRSQGTKAGLSGAELDAYAHAEATRDTEAVAQPTRMGTRSLAELTMTNPIARISWAYASEARQKIALWAWGAKNIGQDPAYAAKVTFLTFVVGGLMSQVLKNLWRELKGDDDESKWSAERLAWGTLGSSLHGVPLASVLSGDSGMLSGLRWTPSAINRLAEGNYDDPTTMMRDIDTVLSAAGLFNDNAAGISTLSHAGLDAAKLLETAFDN